MTKHETSLVRMPPASSYVWRAAAATLRAHVAGASVEAIARRDYPEDHVTPMILRAASTQATLTDPAWAGPLARTAVSEAVQDIVSMSSLEALRAAGALQVDLGGLAQLTIPGRSSKPADAGQWIAEGAPSPVRQYTLLGPTLRPHRLEVITTVTREMSEASNIEAILRALISEGAGVAIDAAMFSANAASPASSAGLLNGLAPIAPTAGGGFDGCGMDLGKLAADIASRSGGRKLVFVASPGQATSMRFWAGGQFEPEAAASAALPDKTVVAIEPSSLAFTFGAPTFSISSVAAVHMEDTAPANIVGGASPGTLAWPVKSMFQIDALAMKMQLWGAWCMRAPHVSFMNAVNW